MCGLLRKEDIMANGGQIDLGQIIVNLSQQGGRAVGERISNDVNRGKDILRGLFAGGGALGTGLLQGMGLDIPTTESAPTQQSFSMTEQQQMAIGNILSIAQIKSQEKQALQRAVDKQLGQNANQFIETQGVEAAQQQLVQRGSELSQLQQQAMNVMQQPEPNFMQRFFRGGASALGVDLGEVSGQKGKARDLVNIAGAQSIIGETPLQQGEIDLEKVKSVLRIEESGAKSILDLRSKIQEKGIDGLSPTDSSKFSLLAEGRDSIVEADKLLNSNTLTQLVRTSGFTPDVLKDQTIKRLKTAVEKAIQNRTRIETGAALSPIELEQQAKKFMPQKGDSIETARDRLSNLFDFFNNSVQLADPTGQYQEVVGGARDAFSAQQPAQEVAIGRFKIREK